MAESLDLVVLGGFFGTGKAAGKLSIFLMGARDADGQWKTVCRLGNGFSEARLAELHAAHAVE